VSKDGWMVAVFKSDPKKAREILVELYEYAKEIEEVKDLHFIIRDRVKNEIVFSFRFMIEEQKRKILSGKIAFKLNNLVAKDNFVVDSSSDHPLFEYEAWTWKVTLKERGLKKFNVFCSFLSELSSVVVNMAKQDYFASTERAELAHVMSWMLGCKETTLLKSQKEVNRILTGLSDVIDDTDFIAI
jgi:hypothetical protein